MGNIIKAFVIVLKAVTLMLITPLFFVWCNRCLYGFFCSGLWILGFYTQSSSAGYVSQANGLRLRKHQAIFDDCSSCIYAAHVADLGSSCHRRKARVDLMVWKSAYRNIHRLLAFKILSQGDTTRVFNGTRAGIRCTKWADIKLQWSTLIHGCDNLSLAQGAFSRKTFANSNAG